MLGIFHSYSLGKTVVNVLINTYHQATESSECFSSFLIALTHCQVKVIYACNTLSAICNVKRHNERKTVSMSGVRLCRGGNRVECECGAPAVLMCHASYIPTTPHCCVKSHAGTQILHHN